MGVSENVVYPIVPNGYIMIIIPMISMAISLGILTQHFQTNPYGHEKLEYVEVLKKVRASVRTTLFTAKTSSEKNTRKQVSCERGSGICDGDDDDDDDGGGGGGGGDVGDDAASK